MSEQNLITFCIDQTKPLMRFNPNIIKNRNKQLTTKILQLLENLEDGVMGHGHTLSLNFVCGGRGTAENPNQNLYILILQVRHTSKGIKLMCCKKTTNASGELVYREETRGNSENVQRFFRFATAKFQEFFAYVEANGLEFSPATYHNLGRLHDLIVGTRG